MKVGKTGCFCQKKIPKKFGDSSYYRGKILYKRVKNLLILPKMITNFFFSGFFGRCFRNWKNVPFEVWFPSRHGCRHLPRWKAHLHGTNGRWYHMPDPWCVGLHSMARSCLSQSRTRQCPCILWSQPRKNCPG